MFEYKIRPALESESAQIKDLIYLVRINPAGLNWKRFMVAILEDGRLIGCGQIKPHGADVNEVASIAVSPLYRGRGIARKIIEELLRNPARPLYLMCIAHNGPMYLKFGFNPIPFEQMPRYFQRIQKVFDIADYFRKSGEELLVMRLE